MAFILNCLRHSAGFNVCCDFAVVKVMQEFCTSSVTDLVKLLKPATSFVIKERADIMYQRVIIEFMDLFLEACRLESSAHLKHVLDTFSEVAIFESNFDVSCTN